MAEFDPKTARPVAQGQFDPSTAQPVTIGGEFKKGVSGGVDALKSAGLGIVSMLGDATGADRVRDWALKKIVEGEEAARANAPAVGSYENVGGVGDAALYASAGLGQLVPFMASSLASGGAGGFIGKMAGKKAAEEAAKRAIVSGAGEQAARGAAARAAAGSVERGATSALAANTIGTEAGLIQGDIYKETGDTDPLTAMAYGIPAGLLDVLPQLRVAKLATGAKKPTGFVSEIARQAGAEGATESAQTVLERKAVEDAGGSEAFSPEGVSEIINAGIIGALGGGVMGGGGKVISKLTERAEAERPPIVGPLSDAANTAIDSGAAALELAAKEAATAKQATAGAEKMGDKPGAPAAPAGTPPATPPAAPPAAAQPAGTQAAAPPAISAEAADGAIASMERQGRRDAAAMRTFSPDAQPPAVTPAPVPATAEDRARADLSLQNRDRSRAASVAQMRSIAAAPDFDRLGEAPTPDVGAPMASVTGNADVVPEQDLGKSAVITMADGTKIPVKYAVLEADQVLPSHEVDGSANDLYYQPQPGTVRALNNARTAGLRAAYAQGTGETYKARLVQSAAALGLDPRAVMGKKSPVLVRLYDDEWNARADLGRISNAAAGLALSPAETAMNDARTLDMGAFKPGENGEIDTPDNASFMRGFVQALPENERGELMTADGRPTRRLAERVRAAMFAKAYQDPELIAASVEEPDPDLKNVLSALTVAAPSFAGMPDGAMNVRAPLAAAVRFLQESRKRGLTFEEAFKQQDMFGTDPWTDNFARFMVSNLRSPKRMGIGLAAVADFVTQETAASATGDMFGGQPATLDNLAQRVNLYIRGKYGEEARTFGGPADQPAGAAGSAPALGRRGWQPRPRPGTEAHAATPDLFGGQEVAAPEKFALEGQSPAEAEREARARKDAEAREEAERQAADRKRQADASRGTFQLTGSDLPADANPNQGSLLTPPPRDAKPAAEPQEAIKLDGKDYPLDAPNFGLPQFPRTLPDGDPRLVQTIDRYSKEELAARAAPIIEKHFAGKTPELAPVLYLMGGGGGMGKGTVKKALQKRGLMPADDGNVVTLDPDEIKTKDLPEFQEIVNAGDSRGAAITHEESSAIAKEIRKRAIEGGYNLVLDVTMGGKKKALELIQLAKSNGMRVVLFGVTGDPRRALIRADLRARGDGEGKRGSGRYVPVADLLEAHKGFAEALPEYLAAVDEARIYNNDDGRPIEVAMVSPFTKKVDILHEKLYNWIEEIANETNQRATTLREVLGEREAWTPPPPADPPAGRAHDADGRGVGRGAQGAGRRAGGEGAARQGRKHHSDDLFSQRPVGGDDGQIPSGGTQDASGEQPGDAGSDAPRREPGDDAAKLGGAADGLDRDQGKPQPPGEAGEPGAGGRNGGGRGGSGRSDVPRARVKAPPKPKPKRTGLDFRITQEQRIGRGSVGEKYRDNVDAIRLLKTIEAEGRMATEEEQKVLARYVGWGGMKNAFFLGNAESLKSMHERGELKPPDRNRPAWNQPYYERDQSPEWAAQRRELLGLLTAEEYDAARGSTPNAHYTAPPVVAAMWSAAEHLGFKGGRVLEPAMGSGFFFGLMPPDLVASSSRSGVELDSITGRIARQLYQTADIRIEGFERAQFPDGFFDLAISNVPFGDYQVADPKWDKHKPFIHDYFFLKALDRVRPGGVIAFITSDGTMDKSLPKIRDLIAERADLLGAIRLPNDAFKEVAGTEVTTDIIFLRRRMPDEQVRSNSTGTYITKVTKQGEPVGPPLFDVETFSKTVSVPIEDGEPVKINEYFARHPEMMLGKMGRKGTMYGANDQALTSDGRNLEDALRVAIANLPANAFGQAAQAAANKPVFDLSVDVKGLKPGSLFVGDDGTVFESGPGGAIARPDLAADRARVKSYHKLRTTLREHFAVQLATEGDEREFSESLAKLNAAYDAHRAAHGFINKRGPRSLYRQDPDWPLLSSLEKWDEEAQTGTKADIFRKRTLVRPTRAEHADSPLDALNISLNETGRVDLARMAELTGDTEEQLLSDLQGFIFLDPVTRAWTPKDEYLSGNVKQKLREAEAAALNDPAFEENAEALRLVQPKPATRSVISAQIGSAWVPPAVYAEFLADILGAQYGARSGIKVDFSPALSEWKVRADAARNLLSATEEWGTDHWPAPKLLEATLNFKSPKVWTTHDDGSKSINTEATAAAKDKQEKMADEFRRWIWKDPERATMMEQEFNERFNNFRRREFDGSHMTMPGVNPAVQLRKNVKDGAWRIVASGNNVLLAHAVGAGKTFTMIGGGMELKRMGLANKPMYVVPNHMLYQFSNDVLRMYPNANVLIATKNDLQKENRKKFVARAATGDWDAIVITHSQFGMVSMSPEAIDAFVADTLRQFEEAYLQAKADKADPRLLKRLEKRKKDLQAKLTKMADASRKDDAIFFEELGVDQLFVDEADEFKNLWFSTKRDRMPGIQAGDAKKSFDMYLKTRYVSQLHNGKRGVVFATGTPITNSMTEMFTLQRYLDHKQLVDLDLHEFDNWASAFGEAVTAVEMRPDGGGYRMHTRFAKFVNMPMLVGQFTKFADVKTAEMLNLPVPKVKGGKRRTIAVPASQALKDYVATLVERAQDVKDGVVPPNVDNMLKITSDGRKAALHLNLIEPGMGDGLETPSKIDVAVDHVYRIWKESTPVKGTQLVFSDIGVNDGPTGFSVYTYMREKLAALGIPREEMAFMSEATTDKKKQALFEKVNAGKVRVVWGSTAKMGAGTNVQHKLIAKHDLDVPWRPRDIEQRDGRIIRQGNENPEVELLSYVTEGSFDVYMWDTITRKAGFIGQVMRGDDSVWEVEDVDSRALSYAEVKAIATGNPLIIEKAGVDAKVQKLTIELGNWRRGRDSLAYRIQETTARLAAMRSYLDGLKADEKRAIPTRGDAFRMTIEGKPYTEREEARKRLLTLASINFPQGERRTIGEIGGFPVSLEVKKYGTAFEVGMHVDGANDYGSIQRIVSADDVVTASTVDWVARMENIVNGFPEAVRTQAETVASTEVQLEQAQRALAEPFEKEGELNALMERQREIDRSLGIGQSEAQEDGAEGEDEEAPARSVVVQERHQGAGLAAAAVEEIAGPIVERWAGGPQLRVLQSTAQSPVAVPDDTNGLYWNGKVYLFADNLGSPEEVKRVLAHEAVAHFGMRGMLGEAWAPTMKKIHALLKMGNPELRRLSDSVRARYVDEDGAFNLTPEQEADEILAAAVEEGIDAAGEYRPGFGWLKEIMAKIAAWLRSIGVDVPLTVPEIQGMLVGAGRFLRESPVDRQAKVLAGQALHIGWHGSAANFDRFSTAFIGTGEGAQVYGWGLYFADRKAIAEWYKDTISRESRSGTFTFGEKPITGRDLHGNKNLPWSGEEYAALEAILDTENEWQYDSLDDVIASAEELAEDERGSDILYWGSIAKGLKSLRDKHGLEFTAPPQIDPKLYKVDIDIDNGHYLDWEKPIAKQSPWVRERITRIMDHVAERFGSSDAIDQTIYRGQDLYHFITGELGRSEDASKMLLAHGIPGIRYLDNVSRNAVAGKETYNYVVFDDSRVKIQAAMSRRQQTETPEFKRWFGKSMVVDAAGMPLVVYRGEHGETGDGQPQTRLGSITFGSQAAASIYAMSPNRAGEKASAPRVIPSYLRIENPIIDNRNDPFVDMSDLIAKLGDGEARRIALKFAPEIEQTGNWMDEYAGVYDSVADLLAKKPSALASLYFDSYKFLDDAEEVKRLKAAGFDGAIHIGNGETAAELEYKVFDASQIKSAVGNSGAFDRGNANIVMSRRGPMVTGTARDGADAFMRDLYQATAPHPFDDRQRLLGNVGIEASRWQGRPAVHLHAIISYAAKGAGDGTKAMRFLTALADKHGVTLDGTAKPIPLAGASNKKSLTKAQLIAWYKRLGFSEKNGTITYEPKAPPQAPQQLPLALSRAGNIIGGARKGLDAKIAALFDSKETFGWWHKTVGTQYHKAQVDADFRPVFEGAQRYVNDLSAFASAAADRAPTLLPRLHDIKDVFKRQPTKEDMEKVAQAVFGGTLAKKRYTAEELADMGLTDSQVALYREFRAAVDRSITDMAKAEMARAARAHVAPHFIAQAKMAGDETAASSILGGELMRMARDARAEGDEALVKRLTKAALDVGESRVRAQRLMDEGYAPLMRFGRYTVDVVQGQGKDATRHFFGMFETEAEALRMEAEMREAYPEARVTRGVLSQDAYKAFHGLSPDTLELFAEAIGATESEVFQEYLRLAVNNRSALKRLIERKGIAGFSTDLTRVLSTFVTSNSRAISSTWNWQDTLEAAEAIPREKGDVKDEAMRLIGYIQNPQEEAAAFRGFLFFQFLGGSIASALVNMTQPMTMTFPFLARWGTVRAGEAIASMGKLATTGKTSDKGLAEALARAEHEGVVAPHEIHQLYAESIRGFGSNQGVRRGLRLWGSLFALAEQFNRRITFGAAYKVATDMGGALKQKTGFATPYEFAIHAVHETQGVYNKANRPNWARGTIGATVFTFRQYSIAYLEFLKRLPRKQQALALAVLMVAAGIQGLPFADDLDDLVDTFAQALGYNFNTKEAKRKFLRDTLGDDMGGFITHGFSALPGVPLDVQARMGLGNLIPGTGLAKRSDTNRTRDVLDILGPAGGVIQSVSGAATAVLGGDLAGAAKQIAPVAIQNAVKGVEMASMGMYRDFRGRKVLDTDAYDAFVKAVGFQPRAVASESRKVQEQRQNVALARVVESEIASKWAEGIFEKDQGKVKDAIDKLKAWNAMNPEARILITPAQIGGRVRQMALSRAERQVKAAPRELRGNVVEGLR